MTWWAASPMERSSPPHVRPPLQGLRGRVGERRVPEHDVHQRVDHVGGAVLLQVRHERRERREGVLLLRGGPHGDRGAHQVGPSGREAQRHEAAHRVAEDVAGGEVQRLDERGGVVGQGVHVQLLQRGSGALALAAVVVRHDPVAGAELLHERVEHPAGEEQRVAQQQRYAVRVPDLVVGQGRVVDVEKGHGGPRGRLGGDRTFARTAPGAPPPAPAAPAPARGPTSSPTGRTWWPCRPGTGHRDTGAPAGPIRPGRSAGAGHLRRPGGPGRRLPCPALGRRCCTDHTASRGPAWRRVGRRVGGRVGRGGGDATADSSSLPRVPGLSPSVAVP